MQHTDSQNVQARNIKMAQFRKQVKQKLHIQSLLTPESSKNSSSQLKSSKQRRKSSTIIETEDLFKAKYQILEKIGEGSSAVVYKCKHITSGQYYALKVCNFQEQQIFQIKEIFHTLVNLNHPNIIKYKAFYVCIHTNKVYLVMEDFYYSDLSAYIPKDQQQIRIITEKLLSAVEYLHQKGICHRDIKPSNILYNPQDREIKLIDFNVSKVYHKRTVQIQMLTPTGTPQYRAPQTYKGSTYSQKVDQWSVGATIYKLAVNTLPFSFHDQKKMVQFFQKYQENIKNKIFLQNGWQKYSPQFKNIIEKLLAPVQQRISAEQGLKHLWFVINLDPSRQLTKKRKLKIQKKMTYCPLGSGKFLEDDEEQKNLQSQFICISQLEKHSNSYKEQLKDQGMNALNKKIIKEGLIHSLQIKTFQSDTESIHYDSDDETSLVIKSSQIQKVYKSFDVIHQEYQQCCKNDKKLLSS